MNEEKLTALAQEVARLNSKAQEQAALIHELQARLIALSEMIEERSRS